MNKTITLVGALCATFLAFACDGDDTGVPVVVPGAGGAPITGSGGAPTTGSGGGTTTGSGGDSTTGDGSGGAPTDGEPLLDSENVSWVDGAANTKGIQGAFFVLEDSMKDGLLVTEEPPLKHTDLTPDTFSDATSLCVAGTVAAVTTVDGGKCDAALGEDTAMGCQWSAIWGGGIGLNLNETGDTLDEEGNVIEESMESPYNATENGVTGFSFNITGAFDGTIRFKAKVMGSDEDYCAEVDLGPNKVDLSTLMHKCWDDSLATETLDLTNLAQIQWQLVTKQNTEYTDVTFCVESLSVY